MVSTAVLDSGAQSFDSDAPQWPDDAAESAFLSEQKVNGDVPVPKPSAATPGIADDQADSVVPLPSLDSLVNRIPPEAREVLDELFRARFVSVRRVHGTALK